MVTLKPIQWTTYNRHRSPVLHVHKLMVKKSAPTFKEGETVECYITKYDNDRFAVFSESGKTQSKYHVFESVQELHDHFNEL